MLRRAQLTLMKVAGMREGRWLKKVDRALVGAVMGTIAFGVERLVLRVSAGPDEGTDLIDRVRLSIATSDVGDEPGGQRG